jgi:putative ABC transport system permease protein
MWWRRRRREEDLERELRSHLEAEAEDRGDGFAARRAFGNVTRVQEDVREAWGWMWVERLRQDLGYALRGMHKSPGFAVTAVLSLALGIGANTAIFSLIDALMLRWLPVRDPQELVQVKMRLGGDTSAGEDFAYPIIRALADQKEIFAGVCGSSGFGTTVGPLGAVTRASAATATGAYYETLGLNPSVGRLLTGEDDQKGAPAVAVISDRYWERHFARNPEVAGQTLLMGGFPVTIVGVSPAGFDGVSVGSTADITVPMWTFAQINPDSANLLSMGNNWLRVLARPQKGVSSAQAGAHLAAVWPQIATAIAPPGAPAARLKALAGATFEFVPGGTGYTYLRKMFREPLLILMGVVSLVLLIACANVANLLLAQAAARQREIAVRMAIGAGRGRIIRQLLTESAMLSLLGAAFGICVAWVVSRFLVNMLATYQARVIFDLTPNWHVLAFTCSIALGTGLLFGLAPAFQGTAAGPSPALKQDTRMSGSQSRLVSWLVSLQVALSLVLLIGAGLFVRTLQNLQNLDPGFRREGVLLTNVDGKREGYRDARLGEFYKELLEQVQRVPGVLSASLSDHSPVSETMWTEAVAPAGHPLPSEDNVEFTAVSPRYFETMQTPLLRGREFTVHDGGPRPSIAVVDEAFVRSFFPKQDAVGQHIHLTLDRVATDLEIVGVVKDAASFALRMAPPEMVFIPTFQNLPGNAATLEIRAAGSLSQAASAVSKVLQPKLPHAQVEIRAFTDQVNSSLVRERLMATLASGFGALALILSCVGLYGVLAYSVARRTKEMGIRMALGAQRSRVIAMVTGSAIRLVAFGIVLGLPATWAASRWVESMLFGLTPSDPTTIVGAALVLATAALVAAYVPARRASRVDPTTALRHE